MTMIKTVLTYHAIVLCFLSNLYSQSFIEPNSPKRLTQYVLDHWQVKEGLPQNSINAIVQTRDGYIWLGTYEGLVRFNGKNFTVFDRGNTPALLSNRITSLCEDKNGRLWIGSYGGGIVMRDENGFHAPIRDTSFGKYINIASMAVDPFNRVWAITERGVFVVKDSSIEDSYPLSAFGNSIPAAIIADGRGRIWCTANLKMYVIEFGKVWQFQSGRGTAYTAVAKSNEGGVWLFEYTLSGSGYVVKYNDTVEYVGSIPPSIYKLQPMPMREDSRGMLWCYTNDGIATYWMGRWDHLRNGNGILLEQVQTAIEDREGSIWIGSNGAGLWRFRNARFTPIGVAEGMYSDNVWAVYEDSRRTKWIGTLGTGGWCYAVDQKGMHPVTNRAGIYFCFLEDKKGNVWLEGESLVMPDGKKRRVPASFFSSVLALDSLGRMWLTPLHGGIYITEGEKIVDSLSLGNLSADLSIRTMKTDRNGSMWIGTQNGLFHSQNKKIVRYTTAEGLPNNWIRSIYQDADGIVWIATDGGLVKKTNDRFDSYTVKDGLYSNTIHVILEDDSSKLWMSSNKGIFVVKKSDLELFDDHTISRIPCMVYGEDDGMRSAEGNGSYQQGGWRMKDGTLWFATIRGIAIVDPDELKNNTVVPPVHIEKIVSDGKEISSRRSFNLRYPVNDITFYFSALSFRVPSRIQYKYILEGFHTDWIDAGNQNRATFTNLPSGDFVFRVIACNDDGVWNTTGASVAFTLPPPFWATWWFYIIVGVAVFGSFTGLIRYIELKKIRRHIEQLEHEKALERERSRISKDMHDEVGANLTKIAILSELASRNADDTPKYLTKITETSREVIDGMSQIIWAINPKNDKLENMAAYLREYIGETFEMTNIRCVISFPDQLPTESLSAEFRRNIFLTVKEAVHNIVKYSGATSVDVHLAVNGGRISFSIKDNGVGFDLSNPSQFGNGLHNMKKRIGDIGGEFSIESIQGEGTTIEFSVPVL